MHGRYSVVEKGCVRMSSICANCGGMLPDDAKFCPSCGKQVTQVVFCPECGRKNPQEARFCSNCGTHLPQFSDLDRGQCGGGTPMQGNGAPESSQEKHAEDFQSSSAQQTFLGYPIELPPRVDVAGGLFVAFRDLGVSLANNFMSAMNSNYGSLDIFLQRANGEVQALFEQADRKAVDFLTHNGLYSYNIDVVRRWTNGYRGRWAALLGDISKAHRQIEREANAEINYRADRKANRGRVVGGGFGFSAAVDGMLTAGAINAATGLLHSAFNGVGNAMTNIERGAQKQRIFGSSEVKEEIRIALMLDITNTYYGLLDICNEEWPGSPLPVFDEDDYVGARNILEKLMNRSIPTERTRIAVCQMIQAYPVSDYFFAAAAQLLPHDLPEIQRLAAQCGIKLSDLDMDRHNNFCLAAGTLLDNDFYVKHYKEITPESLRDTIRRMLKEMPSLSEMGVSDIVSEHDERLLPDEHPFLTLKNGREWGDTYFMLTGQRAVFKKGSCPLEQFYPIIVRGKLYANPTIYFEQKKRPEQELIYMTLEGDTKKLEMFLQFVSAMLICIADRPVDCCDLHNEIYREAIDRPMKYRVEDCRSNIDNKRQRMLTDKVKATAFHRLQKCEPSVSPLVFFAGVPDCLRWEAQNVLKNVQWSSDEIPLFYMVSNVVGNSPEYADIILATDKAVYLYRNKETHRFFFDAVVALTFEHSLLSDRFWVNHQFCVAAFSDQILASEFAADTMEVVFPMLLYNEAHGYKIKALLTCIHNILVAGRK